MERRENPRLRRRLKLEEKYLAGELVSQLVATRARELKKHPNQMVQTTRAIHANTLLIYLQVKNLMNGMLMRDSLEQAKITFNTYSPTIIQSLNAKKTIYEIIMNDLLENFDEKEYDEILDIFTHLVDQRIIGRM